MALKRLGQILMNLGLVDEQQLAVMLDEQAQRGGELLGKVGVSLGFFSEEQLGEALAEQWGTSFVTLYDREIPSNVVQAIMACFGLMPAFFVGVSGLWWLLARQVPRAEAATHA